MVQTQVRSSQRREAPKVPVHGCTWPMQQRAKRRVRIALFPSAARMCETGITGTTTRSPQQATATVQAMAGAATIVHCETTHCHLLRRFAVTGVRAYSRRGDVSHVVSDSGRRINNTTLSPGTALSAPITIRFVKSVVVPTIVSVAQAANTILVTGALSASRHENCGDRQHYIEL